MFFSSGVSTVFTAEDSCVVGFGKR